MFSLDLPSLRDYWAFFNQAFFIPKPHWTENDIPDLTGKVAIVTGGSAGLGKQTVEELLKHNARVYIAARNQEKTQALIDEYASTTGNTAIFLKLDLSDLRSVKAAAEEFMSKEKELHMLFNNGGVLGLPQLTAQGYDMVFGTNAIGHFFLTKLLLPVLLDTAKRSGKVRVINVASSAHQIMFRKFDFAAFKDGPVRRRLLPTDLYGQSKYANVVFANELARRFGDQGIVSCSVNPGNIKTEIHKNARSFFGAALFVLQVHGPKLGALTQLWAGTSTEGEDFNGKYLVPWCRIARARAGTYDPQLGKELWTWMEEQVKDI